MALKPYIFLILGILIYFVAGLTFGGTILAVFAVYLITGGWRFTKIILLTLPRDMRYVKSVDSFTECWPLLKC
jgi:solute carrier family 27 fatty acid transporter 1/4